MIKSKRKRYDRILTGWTIGAILPVLIFLTFYQLKYGQVDFLIFLKNMWQMKIFMKLVSLCVFPNLGFFFLFYRMKYDMAARGVILATFIYAFLVLVAKLI